MAYKITRQAKVELEMFLLRDKKSMFRASEPDQWLIQVSVGNCIVRTISKPTKKEALPIYQQIREQLGA